MNYLSHHGYYGQLLVYFRCRLSLVRHGPPFAKSRPGQHRRNLRRFVRTQKEALLCQKP